MTFLITNCRKFVKHLITPCVWLVAVIPATATVLAETTHETSHVAERDGLRLQFSLRAAGSERPAQQGRVGQFRLQVTDVVTGQPVRGLRPAAWLDATPESVAPLAGAECRERAGVYLRGSVGLRPLVDFNSYYLLVLNQDASISVIDPLVGMTGRTSLFASIPLKSPGVDWVRSADGSRLFVALPGAREIAVIDAVRFRVTGAIGLPAAPGRLAIQPDGRLLWAGLPDRAVAIDVDTQRLAREIPLGQGHHEFAFDGNGYMLASSRTDRRLDLIDTASGSIVARLATDGEPLALAYSPLARRFYASTGDDKVLVIDAADARQTASLQALPGTGPLQVSPDGRWLIALATASRRALIYDTGGGTPRRTGELSGQPFQMTMTDAFVHIRHLDSARVDMINLLELARTADPVINHYEAGNLPPGTVRDLPLAPGLAPAASDAALFVASPADAAIYYYMEGMNAPAGSFQSYGHSPRAVTVANRSIRESPPGVYTSDAALPAAGKMTVTVMLDAPRVVQCFEALVQIAEGSEPAASPLIDFGGMPRLIQAGAQHLLRFRIGVGERPLAGAMPLVRWFRAPGSDRGSAIARELEDGRYEVAIPITAAGAWPVHVQLPAGPGWPGRESYLTLIAR